MKTNLESFPQVADIRKRANEWQETARHTARKATRSATRYIEDNPWKAIGLVALAAMALAFLLKPGYRSD